ncbi:MAG TPA: DNA-formamidopyrimidine glycosylase family protein [Polyangiaceae bacterium]
MPELPDVEGFRQTFARRARGKRVTGVWSDRSELRNTNPTRLDRELRDRVFDEPRRHGKWLICPTDAPLVLVLHFGMTGELAWTSARKGHRHDRMILQFADGNLHFRDMRKLGGVWLLAQERDLEGATGPLGPDAWRLQHAEFLERLGTQRRGAKAALMDQSFLAGLGNLTVDATLWRARIHPRRDLRSLSPRERETLFDAMKTVLRDSLPSRRVPARADLLTLSRRAGAQCPRCSRILQRATVAGRTTWFCPHCQPRS